MSERNKSFFDKLKTAITKKKRPPIEASLENLGMYLLSDDKLRERLEAIRALHEEIIKPIKTRKPLKKIEGLRDRLNMINATMRQTAIPFGRAGDVGAYAQAMQGWESLYSFSVDILNTVSKMIKANFVAIQENADATIGLLNMMELADKMQGFMDIEVYPYGELIIDMSFFGRDVAPAYATMIQQMGGVDSQKMLGLIRQLLREEKPDKYG